MREHEIETKVSEYAETRGYLPRKMQYIGRRGCADHFYFGPAGHLVIIEFKKPKGVPESHQIREADRLRNKGFTVHFIDDIEAGKALFR